MKFKVKIDIIDFNGIIKEGNLHADSKRELIESYALTGGLFIRRYIVASIRN